MLECCIWYVQEYTLNICMNAASNVCMNTAASNLCMNETSDMHEDIIHVHAYSMMYANYNM